MEKHIYNEQNGLYYELAGDYYLPCLSAPKMPVLSIWGQRRLKYLREHRSSLYTGMLLSGQLGVHLEEIDRTATRRHALLMQKMANYAGITEDLKATDQMAWVQQMNAIDHQVQEIINEELIYA